MQVKSVKASAGRTVKVDQFEFLRVDAAVEIDVELGDDPVQAQEIARDTVAKEVANLLKRMYAPDEKKEAQVETADSVKPEPIKIR